MHASSSIAKGGSDDAETLELVSSATDAGLPPLFSVLLGQLARDGTWRPQSWVRLLERGEAIGLLDAWFEAITDRSINIVEELSDIPRWLGKAKFGNRLLHHFRGDLDAWLLARKVRA
ncbi:hypothetical protein EON82_22205, partial [bacterium]